MTRRRGQTGHSLAGTMIFLVLVMLLWTAASRQLACHLRVDKARQIHRELPAKMKYARLWGLNARRLARAKPGLVIMHPGPINRGVEITPEAADGPRSVILRPVSNGVAVRMAVLKLVTGAAGGPAGG